MRGWRVSGGSSRVGTHEGMKGGGRSRRLGRLLACGLLAGAPSSDAFALPPCPSPDLDGVPVLLGVSTRGHTLGGDALVSLTDERWSLTMLSAGGLELFTAEGPPAVVRSGLPEALPWLEKIPFERDLRLALTPPGDCAVGEGRLVERGGRFGRDPRRVWKGPGGRAVATLIPPDGAPGKVVVEDHWRRYTLTVVVPDTESPEWPR